LTLSARPTWQDFRRSDYYFFWKRRPLFFSVR